MSDTVQLIIVQLMLIDMAVGLVIGLLYMYQIHKDRKRNPSHGSMWPAAVLAGLCLVPGFNILPVFLILFLFSGEGFLKTIFGKQT